MAIAFWDGADKTAMRIDLWTKDMMVDEMADFLPDDDGYGRHFNRATHQQEMTDDMKNLPQFLSSSGKYRSKRISKTVHGSWPMVWPMVHGNTDCTMNHELTTIKQ